MRRSISTIALLFMLVGILAVNFASAQDTLSANTQDILSASATGQPLPRDPEVIARALGTMIPKDTYMPRFTAPSNHVSHYIIPTRIKVGITPYAHCSQWLNAGQPITEVIEMDFDEYVKNVLPNEWPNSWPAESLKAGAVAVKTFAWWRMTLTNPRPQGVDVVDNTCDQRFIRNSAKPTTNAAVDDTWPYRMSRGGLIKNVHYLDTDERCTNTPNLRPCMGQWGTYYKAQDGWSWQQILHHYYDPTDISLTNPIPKDINIIKNPAFDLGTASWNTWGSVTDANVSNGVYRFYRNSGTTDHAVVLQDVDFQVGKGTPMRLALSLGNSSAVNKQISVHLHDVDDWNGVISCAFTLYPNSPPLNYVMWGTTGAEWGAVRIEITGESADNAPYYLVDNVSVQHWSGGLPQGVSPCVEPSPGKPKIVTPIADQKVSNDFNLVLQPGLSNYRPGYNAQFRVQVSTTKAFTTLVYDNEGALATSPTIPLSLDNGTYFVRAQQFDGIDRYGKWTKPVSFQVVTFPGTPTLVGPQGPVDGSILTFMWNTAENTSLYKLQVFDAQNVQVGGKKIQPTDCTTVCSLPLQEMNGALLSGQPYTWRVQAKNTDGKRNSTAFNFTPTIPGIPNALSPDDGAAVTGDVILTWSNIPLANKYRLIVRIPGVQRILKVKLTPEQAACDSTSCSANLTTLGAVLTPNTTYDWLVRAIRAQPHAVSKSVRRTFTVAP